MEIEPGFGTRRDARNQTWPFTSVKRSPKLENIPTRIAVETVFASSRAERLPAARLECPPSRSRDDASQHFRALTLYHGSTSNSA